MGTPWGKLYKASLWEKTQFFEGYGFEDSIVYLDIYPQCKKFYLEGTLSYCFRSGKIVYISGRKIRRKASTHSGL